MSPVVRRARCSEQSDFHVDACWWLRTPSGVHGFESSQPAALRGASELPMIKKSKKGSLVKEMRAEYTFSEGHLGKYAARFKEGAIVVVLEPDVAAVYPNSEAVNAALRKVAGQEERSLLSGTS